MISVSAADGDAVSPASRTPDDDAKSSMGLLGLSGLDNDVGIERRKEKMPARSAAPSGAFPGVCPTKLKLTGSV
jgi:hypothetical protein